MVQPVKAPKPDVQSLISGIHMLEGEKRTPQVILWVGPFPPRYSIVFRKAQNKHENILLWVLSLWANFISCLNILCIWDLLSIYYKVGIYSSFLLMLDGLCSYHNQTVHLSAHLCHLLGSGMLCSLLLPFPTYPVHLPKSYVLVLHCFIIL